MFRTLRRTSIHQPAGKRLHRHKLAGMVVLTISFAAAVSTLGCGNQYRPVVSAISPVGPAAQATKYAIAVSSPSSSSPGLVTDVDFSGDTVLATPQVLTNPSYLVLNSTSSAASSSASSATSSYAYVFNDQGSLDLFPFTTPSTLITSTVTETTLPTNSVPISMTQLTPASALSTLFIPETSTATGPSVIAVNGTTAALYDTVPVAPNPVYVVGATGTPRVYAISQGATPGGPGEVDSIETISTLSLSNSAQFTVGINPVYGVMTPDDRRAFILNQGSGTVSVINVPNNAPDVNVPTITVGANPVWADLNTVDSELVVLNQGTSTTPGSLSIISIPLCSALAQATNPNCSTTNPVDAAGFGTVVATAPVGFDPTMVSVMQGTDGNTPAAYVINQADSTGTCGSSLNSSGVSVPNGSVTAVNLASGQVSATICGVSGTAATAAANGASNVIFGHPNSVSATGGLPTGKVYVTAADNTYMDIIYTDTNTVQTHIPLQGTGLRVLVTSP